MSEEVRIRRWTRKEYDTLIELGVLHEDEPVELVGGQLIVSEPQYTRHATAIRLANQALRRAFPDSAWQVDVQLPIALDEESEPEPDLSVVPGTARDYLAEHPTRPVLVVEVAESSLQFDRRDKGSLYARAGIIDYWIVNLVDDVVEVFRDPVPAPGGRYGWEYRSIERLGRAASISPLAASTTRLALDDFLP